MNLKPLPIDSLIPQIAEGVKRRSGVVVVAPPGAGKTTRIPPALAASGAVEGAVVMLQPRRVAARAAAARIADERGWKLGEEVGYHIRFDRRIGPNTKVRVLTEGILTRMLASDPFLEGIDCVILDEFHERSIHTDLALAMLREVQATVRDDLRIVVMSATMDPTPVAKYLGEDGDPAPVFESAGRLHPIEVIFQQRADLSPRTDQAAAAAREVLLAPTSETGHVLVFLPGIGEIRRAAAQLTDIEAEVHVLHSSVSSEDQDRALRPSTRRKVILATNIAETSLTIDGVRTVIDAGLARVLVSDARLGIDRLELRRISKASAIQRAGRAGRTAPGRCIRLWTRAEDSALPERDTPEVQRIDLAQTLLTLHAFGVKDPAKFGWFEPPRPDALARAARLLEMLGATAAA